MGDQFKGYPVSGLTAARKTYRAKQLDFVNQVLFKLYWCKSSGPHHILYLTLYNRSDIILTVKENIMKLQTIRLNVQTTPVSTAQPYKGGLIVKLLDIQIIENHPTMFVIVDESQTQECENYVQRVNQPFDKPFTQFNMPTILRSSNGNAVFNVLPLGYVVVSSTCFGSGNGI